MSKITEKQTSRQKVSLRSIKASYDAHRPLTMITCYDFSFARILDETEVDIILVGDSLGNVVLGLPDTIHVTMDDVEFCVRGTKAGLTRPLLVADMPFMSFADESTTLRNVERLMRAGAEAVKIEGGKAVTPFVKKIVELGIPVMGHVGFTPQSIHKFGGYRVQGRTEKEAQELKEAAMALEDAGAFSIVLELVPADCAAMITQSVGIPTIGIGAGRDCSGQVLVMHDLLGFDEGKPFKHVKSYMALGAQVKQAFQDYVDDVVTRRFPTDEQSFS